MSKVELGNYEIRAVVSDADTQDIRVAIVYDYGELRLRIEQTGDSIVFRKEQWPLIKKITDSLITQEKELTLKLNPEKK